MSPKNFLDKVDYDVKKWKKGGDDGDGGDDNGGDSGSGGGKDGDGGNDNGGDSGSGGGKIYSNVRTI